MGLFSSIGKFFKNILGDIIGFLIGVDFDEFDEDNKGTLLNSQSNVAPLPVIYGKRRIGGTRAFIATGPATKTGGVDANTYLYVCLVLCEGEIHLIRNDTGIYIDDELVSFTGTGATLTSQTGTRIGDRIKVQRFYGRDDGKDATQTLTYSTLLAEHPDWTSAHALKGVAYLALRFEYDQNVFRSIPTVNAEVFGRPLYDPFTQTTYYSSNPALILRDYLTNTRYGKGLPSSAIDDTSFTAAKNHLDLTVLEFDYSTTQVNVNPFGCRIDTSKTVFSNVKELLQGMRGLLPYREGKYSLLIDKSEAVDSTNFQLHPGNITSDIAVQQAGKKQRYNRVIAKFVNPEADYQLDTAMWPEKGDSDYDDYLEEDNDEELIKNITINTLIKYSAVRDLCRVILLASRTNVNAVQLTATSEAMDVSVGDIVVLEHPSLGWTGTAKQNMRVVDTQITDDGDVKLSLIEYNSSIYQWQAAGAPPDNLSTDLPDMTEAPAPTNLTATESTVIDGDGKVVPSVDLSWTAADTAFVEEYHVQWKKDSQSIYVNESRTVNTQLDIFNLEFNPDSPVTYDFRVRTMNTANVYSDFVETTEIINGDDTPPANVTNLSARGDFEGIVVQWTNPADKDFSHTEIHSVTSNTEPAESADPTVSVMGEQFVEYDLEPDTQKYYFARTVDRSGNKSDFSSAVTATATAIRIKNLGLLLNQNGYPTDLNVSEIKEGEEYEVLTLGTTSTFGWGGLGSQGTVGDVFTATRDGTKLDGTGTVEHTSYESNNGEFTLVGQRLSGEYRYGEDASIVWNGKQIDITSDNHDGFTGLTNLSGKQGWIGFDRNLTAPFDMSGTLPSINVGFVYYEDGQWYYDDDSANPVSFNPDSFTGTTSGTDGTTTARIVALGTLKTGSSADSIAEGGLFGDPLDLKTVELPDNFIDVTKFATQLESDNYVQDTSGWKIERSGDTEFNDITARGTIYATGGQIGGVPIGDITSMVNGSLALYINKDAGQTTANGEGALVGLARDGTPVNDSDGFIVWDGSKITIESDQLTSTASFATQVQNQRGFIVFDVNKSNPFDISAGTVQSIDVAFAYKIDDQWYYDDNTTATPTSGQTFDPENTSGAEFVALGWLETGSSDVIKYGGLYGQPVALTLAGFPSDALESGTIGGISISNDKLYEGVGTFKDANTGFYLDSGGDFSLKDKLSFDNSAGELIVDGTVRADVIDIVDGNLYGDVEASSVSPGQVGIDQVSEAVYNEIKRRFINTNDGFYFTDTDSVDGTSVYTYITTGDLGNSALTTEPIELEAVFTYRFTSSTNYTANSRAFFARFEWSSTGTQFSTVSVNTEVRHEVTQTQTEFGYVYELNVVQRETVTLPSNYGYLRLTVQANSSGSNSIWAEHALAVSFVADQAGLIIGSAATTGEARFPDGAIISGLTYPDADGTNGQVITTDGSGNLSFSSSSGGLSDVVDDTTPQLGGDLDTNGNDINFGDNDKAVFGAGNDLQLYHDGLNSYINDTSGTGNLYIASNQLIINNAANSENMARFAQDGAATLYHNGSAKIATTSTGVEITGAATVGGNTVWHAGNDGAGSGLAADTLDGYHAAQTSGDWFNHIPKVDGNGNMEIGRFTDWHYTDTSTASYDARSEILSTGVLRHTTAYGYIDLGPANTSYAHISTDRAQFYFNKKLIVDEGIIRSYDEDLQLAAGYAGATSITIDHADNEVTFNESINIANSKVISHNQTETRDKIRVWNSSLYTIGFDDAMTYGHLGGYAMTFQMSDHADRGWVFLDSSDTDAQGAMSLTTQGEMTVAASVSIGEGKSVTSPQTDVLYVKGNPNFAVMPTFETEGKIIISRADNADREHEIRFNNSSLNADNYIRFAVHNGSVGNQVEVMNLRGDGTVGIGTQNPSANLEIQAGTAQLALDSTGSSYSRLIHQHNGTAVWTAGTRSSSDYHIYRESGSGDVIIDSGSLGVNQTNPTHTLDVSGSARFVHSTHQGFKTTVTDSTANQAFHGHYLDVNMSGSDTLTADRTHAGLYLDLDSSATGGDVSNEHRVYGIYSDVRITGDSDLAYGSYSIARSSHNSGTVTTLIGAQGYGFANNSAGKTTSVYGAYNFGRSSVTGTGEIDNVYGAFNLVHSYQTSTDTGTICYGSSNLIQYTGSHNVNANQARGIYAEIQIDANSNSWTLSNAYVVRAEFDNNDSGNRTNNGYLFYGNYSGTRPTNAWGIYINSDVKNYIAGPVGIGTTSVGTTMLDVYGGSGIGRARFFYLGTSANYIDVDSHYWRTAAGSTRALLSSTNLFLYLNNANQTHRFTFNESGGEITLGNGAGTDGTLIDLTTGASRFISTIDGHSVQIGCGGSNTTGSTDFMNAGFGSVAMRVQNNGSVSIGTTVKVFNAGGLPLIVGSGSGNQGMTIYSGTASSGSIHFADTATTGVDSYRGRIRYDHNTADMILSSNAIDSVFINSVGSVGINNSDPDSTLNVKGQAKFGDTTDATQIRINASSNSGIVEGNAPSGLILRSNYVGSLSHIVFNTNGSTEAMRIRHDQKLLFGTISVGGEGGVTFNPSHSNGAAQQIFNRASTTSTSVVMRFRNAGTNVGQISHTNSSTSYITTSDRRLKENIVDAPSASDDIEAIQVRSFDWKESGEHQKYGMIAQELQAVAPDAVSEGDEDDDIMGVDYSKLVPMLIKEIQSLRARVAQLEEDE